MRRCPAVRARPAAVWVRHPHRMQNSLGARNVVFQHAQDVTLKPEIKIYSHNVAFRWCHPEFVYYTMHPRVLRRVRSIFITPYPGLGYDADIFYHRWKPITRIYLPAEMLEYKKRWAYDIPNVVVISDETMTRYMTMFENFANLAEP